MGGPTVSFGLNLCTLKAKKKSTRTYTAMIYLAVMNVDVPFDDLMGVPYDFSIQRIPTMTSCTECIEMQFEKDEIKSLLS
jgi:hypothetical protein